MEVVEQVSVAHRLATPLLVDPVLEQPAGSRLGAAVLGLAQVAR